MQSPIRRLLLALGLTVVCAFLICGRRDFSWTQWRAYSREFIQADGRVVDRTSENRSTSETQAYSLFFSLVANDRARFDRILKWTEQNLARGDLASHLPAWLWGQRDDASWGIKDPNPASDADLWIAYTLIEAARLWKHAEYERIGRAMLTLIKKHEVAEVPGLGLMLLPAPHGFHSVGGVSRLNPSYLPEFQFRWLAIHDRDGPWAALWQNHMRAMRSVLSGGVAPDWYMVSAIGNIMIDTQTQGTASYDAIRVALWAGMTPSLSRPAKTSELQRLLKPYADIVIRLGRPPERIDTRNGRISGVAPIGFSAAVLPFLSTFDEDSSEHQRQRLKSNRVEGNLGNPPHYYDQALAMFGEGWDSGHFRFEQNGQVTPRWEKSCCDWSL